VTAASLVIAPVVDISSYGFGRLFFFVGFMTDSKVQGSRNYIRD
jgi:hypothetical protein